jgi:hypothetical protein
MSQDRNDRDRRPARPGFEDYGFTRTGEVRPQERRGASDPRGRDDGWGGFLRFFPGNEYPDRQGQRQGRGDFRGVGPKGYRRSDERIAEDVNDRLSADPRLDATDVLVSVKDGELALNGEVESRDDKRVAEDVAEGVSGVRHVQNNLRVRAGLR